MALFTIQSLHFQDLFQRLHTQGYGMDEYNVRVVEVWLAAVYGPPGTTLYDTITPAELDSPEFCLEMYRLGWNLEVRFIRQSALRDVRDHVSSLASLDIPRLLRLCRNIYSWHSQAVPVPLELRQVIVAVMWEKAEMLGANTMYNRMMGDPLYEVLFDDLVWFQQFGTLENRRN